MGNAIAGTVYLPVAVLIAFGWYTEPKPNKTRAVELVKFLSSPKNTAEAHTAALQELKKQHPSVVIPTLLAEIERAGIGAKLDSNGMPISERPGEEHPKVILLRVWSRTTLDGWEVTWSPIQSASGDSIVAPGLDYVGPPWKKVAVGKALAVVLAETKSEETRERVIYGIRNRYVPEAERPLADVLRGEHTFDRLIAMEILLAQHPRKYADEVIDLVADGKLSKEARSNYLDAFTRPAYQGLDEPARKRLIRAGFALLADHPSYLTACRLEDIVGVRFKPNQQDPKYQDKGNLNAAFFSDTVKAALEWWAAQRKNYE